MKLALASFLFFCTTLVTAQEHYVRYNQAGYKKGNPKSLIINAEENLSGSEWTITRNDSVVLKGNIKKSLTGKGDHTNLPFNYKVDFSSLDTEASYKFHFKGAEYSFLISNDPYSTYIKDVLRYLRQQRSGSNEGLDKKPGHFGDSAALVYSQVGEKMEWEPHKNGLKANAIGGWYDAGDYLKFTLTTAYATYNLLRAYEENPSLFDYKLYSKSDLNDILDEAKFGLDYLTRCLVNDSTFIFQIGDSRDHNLGNRLPADDTNEHRYAYCSMSRTHMAFNSAALAVGARIFKDIDSTLANEYLVMAEKLFQLSELHKGVYWYQKAHEIFYADKSPFDNLLLASAELARTTENKDYEGKVKYYSSMAGRGYWASWSEFNMIAHARAGKYYSRSTNYLISDLEGFETIAIAPENIWKMPHEYTWGSLYSFFNVAYASLLHDSLTKTNQFGYLAQEVVDYTFGKNNWGVSFLASEKLSNSVQNIYSQAYILQPRLFPTGGIAEGPGDNESHLEMVKWFQLSREAIKAEKFNTNKVVFYDDATDFQTMETTIAGLSDGIFLLSLISK